MSESDDDFVIALAAVVARRKRRKRRWWVHPIIVKRLRLGEYNLVQELRSDAQRFNTYFRMSTDQFDQLLHTVGPKIMKQTTRCRSSLEPAQRLAICLRYDDLDLDPIPTTILKKCPILIPTITNIVNLSLASGLFPD